MLRAAILARRQSMTIHIHSMADFKQWSSQHALTERASPLFCIFICSTVENEQPTEEAGPCVRFFHRRAHDSTELLANRLVYAVLGLGDSNLLLDRQTTTADDCNQVAARLDVRLAALGAERLHACGKVDDRTGNRELEPWIAECAAALLVLPS